MSAGRITGRHQAGRQKRRQETDRKRAIHLLFADTGANRIPEQGLRPRLLLAREGETWGPQIITARPDSDDLARAVRERIRAFNADFAALAFLVEFMEDRSRGVVVIWAGPDGVEASGTRTVQVDGASLSGSWQELDLDPFEELPVVGALREAFDT